MKSPLLLVFALLWSIPQCAQPAGVVSLRGTPAGARPGPAGQIRFSIAAIPANGHPNRAYIGLRTYALTPHSGLYFTAFLRTSLTQALHQQAPRLPLPALARAGTYQFRFYVDGQLIYLANLPAAAVTPASKSTETVLHQPLIHTGNPSSEWGPVLWQQFLANGGDRALPVGQHLLRLEIWPYYQHPLLRDARALAAGQVALDVTAPIPAW